MLVLANEFQEYLKFSNYINGDHILIQEKVQELEKLAVDKIDFIRRAYHFVRDKIAHSWDIKDKIVTVTASQVLKEGAGICYAKSNLLAALLRAASIPVGICYQRLTLGDTPESGYCVHALNAVYIAELNKWVRMDARGNKGNVHAEFSIDKEILAFNIRPEYDEKDYPNLYAEPLPDLMAVLENSDDAIDMYLHHLPEKI